MLNISWTSAWNILCQHIVLTLDLASFAERIRLRALNIIYTKVVQFDGHPLSKPVTILDCIRFHTIVFRRFPSQFFHPAKLQSTYFFIVITKLVAIFASVAVKLRFRGGSRYDRLDRAASGSLEIYLHGPSARLVYPWLHVFYIK